MSIRRFICIGVIRRITRGFIHSSEMKEGSESVLEVTVKNQSLNVMWNFGRIDTEEVSRSNGAIVDYV